MLSGTRKEEESAFKVLVLGDSGTQKFDVITRYLKNDSNISKDFAACSIDFEGKAYKLQIWDTAGDSRFRSLLIPQFKNTRGVILVYNTNSKKSFNSIATWLNEVKQHARPDVQIVLIGHTVDLTEEIEVPYKEGKKYAESLGIAFFEASAKQLSGIRDMFQKLTGEMVKIVQAEIRQKEEEEEARLIAEGKKKPSEKAPVKEKPKPQSPEVPQKNQDSSPEEPKNYDYVIKIVVLGARSVGKSNLANQFAQKAFSETSEPSSKVKIDKRSYKIDGKAYKVEVWDIPGERGPQVNFKTYFEGAHGIVLVYDITSKESFTEAQRYLEEAGKYVPKDIPRVLVGNKKDLEGNRQVSFDETRAYADSQQVQSIETSAKTEEKSVITSFASQIIQKIGVLEKAGLIQVQPGKDVKKNNEKDGGCNIF